MTAEPGAVLVVGGPALVAAARAFDGDGRETRAARDGAEALELVARARSSAQGYRLAIVDVEAPEVGGLALLRALSLQSPPLPVLAVLPALDRAVLEQALALGAVEFILGPPHGPALALRASNALALQRSRDVLDSLRELVCRWSPERGVTFVNAAVVQYLGLTAAQLLGASFEPFVLEEDREALRAHVAGLTPASPVGTIAHRVRLPSGAVRWTEWTNRALYAGGQLVEFQSVGRDTTDERLALERLRASEERGRAMLAALPDLLFWFDRDGRLLEVLASDPSLLTAPRELIVGRTLAESFARPEVAATVADPTAHVQRALAAIRAALDTGALQRFEYELGARWFEVRVVPAGGGLALAVARDVTSTRTALQSLARAEASLRQAQAIARLGSWEVDFRTGGFSWSDGVYRLLDLDPATAPSLPAFLGVIHPDDRARVAEELERIRVRGASIQSTFRVVRPDGRCLHVDGLCEVDHGPEGAPLRVRGTIQDVTERELRLAEQRALQERLLRAQKDEGLGRMAKALAHSFGSTFGALLGQLELARTDDPADRDEVLRDATRTVARAAELTHSLRLYAGGGRAEQVAVELTRVCQEARQLLTASLPRPVRLTLHGPTPGPSVLADPGLLYQALHQLVANAAESTARPVGVSLHVGLAQRAQLGGWATFPRDWQGPVTRGADELAVLAVVDDGDGMEPGALEHLFDPFVSTKALGRGLGLSLVLSAARSADGAVAVATHPGAGTAVCLLFPLLHTSAETR